MLALYLNHIVKNVYVIDIETYKGLTGNFYFLSSFM